LKWLLPTGFSRVTSPHQEQAFAILNMDGHAAKGLTWQSRSQTLNSRVNLRVDGTIMTVTTTTLLGLN
jgi:hypothetical protein